LVVHKQLLLIVPTGTTESFLQSYLSDNASCRRIEQITKVFLAYVCDVNHRTFLWDCEKDIL